MMKKLYFVLLIIGSLSLTTTVKSQVIFQETFDNISGPTAGGPGTYSFPSGWTLANVDNRTPDPSVSYVNDAWERREDFANNVADSAAFSTSWYSPAGQADDWMWTPGIALSASGTKTLSWRAIAYDASFPDGYEVRIMTVPPTGSTGNIGNMVSSSTLLFSVTAENSSWTNRSVDISTYNGSTVYIGFRNHSSDEFLLLIDDIVVETPNDYNAQTDTVTGFEYTEVPFNQVTGFTLGGSIKNSGAQALTNVNLKADVLDSFNAVVYSGSGTAVSSLAPGASHTFSIPNWVPSGKGNFTIKYYPVLAETDQKPSDDTLSKTISITDSTYARDDGNVTGSLGIGAENGGYLGESYTITSPVYLTSVTLGFTRGYTGRRYAAVIWDTDGSGVPVNIIASTDTLLYPSDDPILATIPISGGRFSLSPGKYVVTAVEFDSTLALATSNNIFTPGSGWIDWPTNPAGTWANPEDFGSTFAISFVVRPNLRTAAELPVQLISFTGVKTSTGNKLQWTTGVQDGVKQYDIERSSDGTRFTSIGTVAAATLNNNYTYNFMDKVPLSGTNFYRLKIADNIGITYSHVINLSNAGRNITILSPNPAKTHVTLQSDNTDLLNKNATLINAGGEVVRRLQISSLPFTIDVSGLQKGMYLLQLEDKSVYKIIKQ